MWEEKGAVLVIIRVLGHSVTRFGESRRGNTRIEHFYPGFIAAFRATQSKGRRCSRCIVALTSPTRVRTGPLLCVAGVGTAVVVFFGYAHNL